MRRILIIAGVVLVFAVGIAVAAINTVAAGAIEAGVEAGLGVPADVGSVRLRLLMGSFSMDDLAIGNAPGFEAKRFLSLGHTETSISYGALRRGEVVLEKLVLSDLVIDLEWQGRKANYDAILDGMSRSEATGEAEAETGGAADESSSTVFIIDELLIQNVTARLRLKSKLAKLDGQEVHLPEIRLTGIGRGSGGAQLSAVTREVMGKLLTAVLKQSKASVPQLADQIGPALGELRGLAGGSGDKAGSAVKKLEEAAGGLLDRFRGGRD